MIEKRLQELGLELPPALPSKFEFTPVLIHQGIAYISGQVPRLDGKIPYLGKVGSEVSIDEARQLAEICVLRGLSSLKEALGSLDQVEQVLKVTGFVQSAPGFSEQPRVIDAASALLKSIFGKKGEHARSAVGVAELPSNTPVEIEFIVAVKENR